MHEVAKLQWDLLVIDEAHEGVDTFKTHSAFSKIERRFTLHLSGTPFKALANEKFPAEAIFNWTYADECKAKDEWDEERGLNPYEEMPKALKNCRELLMKTATLGPIKLWLKRARRRCLAQKSMEIRRRNSVI